ncbi:MAG: ATP-binding protein [Sandaracinus sp.]
MSEDSPVSKIPVHVEPDHLSRLGSTRRPALALAELIWNALDADARTVRVEIDRNALGGIDAIRVVDDGIGMSRDLVTEYFGKLGGSWKASRRATPGNRVLHGKQGEGRFRAFALGSRVEWLTRHRADDGDERELSVVGSSTSITAFEVAVPAAQMLPNCGTTVTITKVPVKGLPGLSDGASEGLIEELTQHFALYLMQ